MTLKPILFGLAFGFLSLSAEPAKANYCIASTVELTRNNTPVSNRLLIQGSNYASTVVYYLSGQANSTYWLLWELDGAPVEETDLQPLITGTYWVTNSGGAFTAPGPGIHRYTFTADSRSTYGYPNSKTLQFAVATSFFALAEANISGYESTRAVDLVVWRYGATNTSASIRLAASNITATSGVDFGAIPGTLSWAAGDPPAKTVTVSVVDDALAEGMETFSVRLHTPAGAATGDTIIATVSINDNDSGNVAVTLTPPEAATAGAMWQLDSSGWRSNGTMNGVVTGLHTVSFKSLSGWIAPASLPIVVTDNGTTNLSPSYQKIDTGTLADAVDAPALAFTMSGKALWFRQTTNTHDGSDAAESGNVNDSESCALMTTVQGPGTLTYWWSVSSEGGDELSCYVDNVLQAEITGSVAWRCVTNILPAGSHTLKWVYAKNTMISLLGDCGRLDEMVWTPLTKPAIASNPAPAHLATGIATNTALTWAPSARAAEYRIHAGTNATPPYVGSTTGTTYTPAPPGYSKTVYWRVNATNEAGMTTGTVWRFTTLAATRIIGLSGNLAFGPLVTGLTATATLTLTNGGNDTLIASGITCPPGFSGSWSGAIPAGGSRSVTVTFAPSAMQSYDGTITVQSDKTSGGNTIAVTGTGIGRVLGLPPSLSFGNVLTGLTATASLIITNRGNAALTVSSIGYPAGFTGAWAGTIPAYGSQSVTVTFTPGGLYNHGGFVTVNSDKTSGGNQFTASGTGIGRNIGLSGNLSFGNVNTGATATATLTITNGGNASLAVSSIAYPAGFSGDWSGAIPAGASRAVTVTFAPAAVQPYSGTITVQSDKSAGINTIGCSGTGTVPTLRIVGLSGSLAFGSVVTGLTATAALIITNSGNSALAVSSIGYPAAFSGAWAGSVPAGGSQSVPVTFAPSAMQGYNGTITVQSDKTSGGNTIPVSGTGIGRNIGLSGNLSFGLVPTNQTATAPLTITNIGNAALSVTSITYPAGFSGDWSGSIPAGGSHIVTVTFAPTEVKNYGGTLFVQSDKTYGPSTWGCAGTGTIPYTRIIGLSGNLAFGSVMTGQSATATLTITNSGTGPLGVAAIHYPAGFSGAWSGNIAAGGTRDVTVTFAPALVQAYTGAVTVDSDMTEGTNTIAIEGLGLAPQPGHASLNAAAAVVNEGTVRKFYVTRSGGSNGTVSVKCVTVAKTAVAWQDFKPVNTILTWRDGETGAKKVALTVYADGRSEGLEKLLLSLKQPVGLTLASPFKATITIPGNAKSGAAGADPLAARMIRLADVLGVNGLTWFTSSRAPWEALDFVAAEGGPGVRSGSPLPGELSWLETEVEGPGTLRFDWQLKSGGDAAGLLLANGRILRAVTPGNQPEQVTLRLEAGTTTLRWVFVDGRYSSLLFLDRVSWEPISDQSSVIGDR